MLLIMMISFCAFCTIPKEADSLNLDKVSIDHNNYLTNHGEPVKIGDSYLTEIDVEDSDEETLFDYNQFEFDYDHYGKGKAHEKAHRFLQEKIPQPHKVITKQPTRSSSSEEVITYNIGENIYAGMDRHIPECTDDTELAEGEFENLKEKPLIEDRLGDSEALGTPEEEVFESNSTTKEIEVSNSTVPETTTVVSETAATGSETTATGSETTATGSETSAATTMPTTGTATKIAENTTEKMTAQSTTETTTTPQNQTEKIPEKISDTTKVPSTISDLPSVFSSSSTTQKSR